MSKVLRFLILILGFSSGFYILSHQESAYPANADFWDHRYLQEKNLDLQDLLTSTSSNTFTPTFTNTQAETATNTPTHTSTPTASNTPTHMSTPTASNTPTHTSTPTASNTPTHTSTPTASNTPTHTSTPTASNTPTHTSTPTATNTSIPTDTPTGTATNTPSPTPTNSPPTISDIDDQNVNEDNSTGPITFSITDKESPANTLTITASSSNTNLVSTNQIAISGNNLNRAIMIVPKVNQTGDTIINITVSDGQKEASESFKLTVRPVNDAPFIDLNGGSSGTDFRTTFVSREGRVLIVSSNLLIQDVDNSELSSARIAITNRKDGGAEKLSVSTSGTSLSANFSAGVLTVTGQDTIANYQKVLRTTSYQNNKDYPNGAIREITFQLDDGSSINGKSNIAHSEVKVHNPSLTISKQPDSQTIASGGTAVFTIEVKNDGNVNLRNVKVTDPLAPNCSRTIGNIRVGATELFTCSKQNTMNEFINDAKVDGRDNEGNKATDSDTARIEVENPNIQIIKSPATQTVLKDENANFEIFVVNTSNTVDLVNVSVEDPNSPDCDRQGDHDFNNLAAGETALYSCETEQVAFAFTNVITVTGENLLTQEIIRDSGFAKIELLDLNLEISTNVTNIPSSGQSVTFTVIVNNIGSKDFELIELKNEILGSLLDPGAGNWLNNSCFNETTIQVSAGEVYSCQVSAYIKGVPPEYEFILTSEVRDSDGNTAAADEMISISISDAADIHATLSANKYTVPAPSGSIIEYLTIENLAYTKKVTINSINHSILGSLDGIGNCQLPLSLSPQEKFECQYSVNVSGQVGQSKTHSIQISGESSAKEEVNDEAAITLNIISPNIQNILFPFISKFYSEPEEENDHPCSARPLMIGKVYSFLADDENDWFYIDVNSPGQINITLSEFEPKDGQLAVWSGSSCDNLTTNNAHNANFHSLKSVSFAASRGRFFIWITNFDGLSYDNPYKLQVTIS